MVRGRKIYNKLTSQLGESLTEVLFALLISSAGLLLLANMLTASGKMVVNSRESMKVYIAEENRITAQEDSDNTSDGVGTVIVTATATDMNNNIIWLTDISNSPLSSSAATLSDTILIKYYVNTKSGGKPVISYKAK